MTSIATIDIFRLSSLPNNESIAAAIYLLPHEGSITNRQLRRPPFCCNPQSAILLHNLHHISAVLNPRCAIVNLKLTPRSQYLGIPISLGSAAHGKMRGGLSIPLLSINLTLTIPTGPQTVSQKHSPESERNHEFNSN